MNNDRRKELRRALDLLNKVSELLSEAKEIVETAKDEEREYYDNMPKSLQGGDKGQTADQAANDLEEANDAIDQFDLDDVISKIEEALG